MTLRQHQSEFGKDVLRLLNYAIYLNLDFTFGEVYRTEYQQKWYYENGYSKTINSMHCKKLAIDVNFFFNGKLLDEMTGSEAERIQANKFKQLLAKKWQELNPLNRAGYTWGWDDNHFERFPKDI